MDGEGLKADSGPLPNECATRLDNGVDRISQLPDETLAFILSFLSLKEAASTSVLSSRWSDLWKFTPTLNFEPSDDDYSDDQNKYVEMVNSVIQSHKALSLKQFRIAYPVKKSDKSAVSKWLDFLFSRKVKSLELDFQCRGDMDKVVLEESLRESRICRDPQTLIFLQSLESLHLEGLKVSGEDIELFLRNCPLLRILEIHFATLTSDVEVRGTTDLMLKHLEICRCKGEKSIKVLAPNLTWITFREGSEKLLIESAPKLVGAAFKTMDPHFVGLQSTFISQLRILILKIYYPMEFWVNDFPEMPNLKKLVIECYGGHNHSLLPVISLIRASPRLEEFTFKVNGSLIVPNARIGVMPNVERPKPQNLKVFELLMSDNLGVSDDTVELVMYILDDCVALQKIVIGRRLWLPGTGISTKMRADADYLQQKLRGKVVPNHVHLQFFGCDVVM